MADRTPLEKLTAKQLALVNAYIENGHNKAEAERTAGYTSRVRWDSPNIQAALEYALTIERKALEIRWKRAAMSKGEAVALLSRDARAALIDFINEDGEIEFDGETPGVRSLQEYETSILVDGTVKKKVKIPARTSTISQLAKMLGWDLQEDEDPREQASEIHDTLRVLQAMEEDEEWEDEWDEVDES
jgi:hypothetical protein